MKSITVKKMSSDCYWVLKNSDYIGSVLKKDKTWFAIRGALCSPYSRKTEAVKALVNRYEHMNQE